MTELRLVVQVMSLSALKEQVAAIEKKMAAK